MTIEYYRRQHDPLDIAIQRAELYANITLACLISAAGLLATLLILVAKVVS